MRRPGSSHAKTRCQLEVDIVFANLISHEPVGEWMDVAPFRVLSFDIECMGRKGHFPDPKIDPVIQIACYLDEYGRGDASTVDRSVFTLKGCLPIVGARVLSYDTEQEMLLAWQQYLLKCDPDFLTGYVYFGGRPTLYLVFYYLSRF